MIGDLADSLPIVSDALAGEESNTFQIGGQPQNPSRLLFQITATTVFNRIPIM